MNMPNYCETNLIDLIILGRVCLDVIIQISIHFQMKAKIFGHL